MSSFTSEVKNELILIENDDCCVKAELAAIIQANGVISTALPHMTLDIQTESAAIARRIYTLVRQLFPYDVELLVRRKMRLKKNNVYIVRMRERVEHMLETLNIEIEDEGFLADSLLHLYEKDCCRRAYIRGAFLMRGSVNNPETSSYHLEIFNLDGEHNHYLCELINTYPLNAREHQRKNGFIIYLKEAEKIADFLNIIGANNALFKFEDVRIVRDMRNSVNRLVNCETANLNKTIDASVRQTESIKLIKQEVGLEALPDKLKEIAETRIQYPDVTLKELGELLPSGPLSKSGVNHRLKRIESLAKKLMETGEL
ncbi:MAG TPA: DNA-binding protein WhiA [Pseudogracilibacillus sp.]|nr:DNA-binding protein WhiA [Pseudogracilibacillus sp.]